MIYKTELLNNPNVLYYKKIHFVTIKIHLDIECEETQLKWNNEAPHEISLMVVIRIVNSDFR